MAERIEQDRRSGAPPTPASSRSPESYERLASPALRAAWLLRTGALVGIASSVLGGFILPGLHGIASDAQINQWERISAGVAYAMSLLVAGLLLTGAFDLSRSRDIGLVSRAMLFLGAPGVLAMLIPAFAHTLTPIGSIVLVVATVFVVLGGALTGLRAAHTRILSLTQLVFGFAAIVRLVGWLVANLMPESVRAYSIGRTLAGTGLFAEGVAQMLVVAWMFTRRRLEGLVTGGLALLLAFGLVWMAGHTDSSAPAWRLILRSAISAQGMAFGPIETFFATAAVLLALACALTRHPVAAVTCGLSLALLGRGSFDVPLRALAASAAAIWTALAAVDERAMWKALVGKKKETE